MLKECGNKVYAKGMWQYSVQ